MNFHQNNIENQYSDYNVNIQIITFIVITMVIILTLVNFIRIYSNEKSVLLKGMFTEANSLKTAHCLIKNLTIDNCCLKLNLTL